jgi:glutathione reductase (NADPH)
MTQRFDVLVIGSGAAGGAAARMLRAEGLTVAMAESGPFGGTCALRGCEPKKVLAETTHTVARVREMAQANGIRGNLSIDWPTLAARKQLLVDRVPPRSERSYQDAGITLLHGRCRFTGPDTARVGDLDVQAAKSIIASGSRPQTLTFPGAELLSVSDDFLNLTKLPARIAFIGGGYVSTEFGHIAAIAGSEVTMAVRGDRCLKRFDRDLVAQLCRASSALGITVLYDSPPFSLGRSAGGFLLRLGAFGEQTVEADMVVHGAGRVPNLDGMDLSAAGIETTGVGLRLDEFLKTSNPNVYAAGDAAGHYQLTPTAVMEGRAVAANILSGDHVQPDYSVIPSATFSHPTLAGVGLTEDEAAAMGVSVEIKTRMKLAWPELTRLGIEHSGYKVLLAPDTGRLLGLFYLGEDAEEVVNVAALAMRQGLTAAQLLDMVWAYPSFGYALRYMLG